MIRKLKLLLLSLSVVLSVAAPVFAQGQQPALNQTDDEGFSFVQMTDLHFGIKGNLENTAKIVKTINEIPFDIQFIVVTGDIFHDGLQDEKLVDKGVSVFEKLKPQTYFIPGNHDIHQKIFSEERSIFEAKFNPLCIRKEIKGTVLLFIYLEPLRKNWDTKNYKPLEVLEENLKQADGKPVIVFTHSPPVNDFYENELHYSWDKENMEKLIKILTSYNVKALVTGHLHRDELHWEGELPIYSCEPVTIQKGRQPAYRIYTYKKDKLSYSTQYLER